MRFSTIIAALAPAGAALAQQTFQIIVGNNSELTFSPSQITTAESGDTLQFIFATKNHTATQSSFADPCTAFTPAGQQQINSGFQPVAAGTTSNFPSYTVQLSNLTGPLWFYCQQTNPISHCGSGMVFAVNPTANKTFTEFQAAANATLNAAANSTATTASAAAASSAVAGASSAGAASSTASGASSAASGSSVPAGSSTASGSATSSAATTTQSSPAGALRVGTAGALLGGVGLLALAL